MKCKRTIAKEIYKQLKTGMKEGTIRKVTLEELENMIETPLYPEIHGDYSINCNRLAVKEKK